MSRISIPFIDHDARWVEWLRHHLTSLAITKVILFGDCRPKHQAAIALCQELDIQVWVFEEGYLRPHYLTLEQNGVNAHSQVSTDPDTYERLTEQKPLPPAQGFRWVFTKRTLTCIWYYLQIWLQQHRFPHYQHYRSTSLWSEG